MIVVDASAVVDLVLGGVAGERVAALLEGQDELFAPAHLPVECGSALWRLVRADRVSADEADSAVRVVVAASLTLIATDALLERAWSLRHANRMADAFYVACAQSLSMPLLTTDARLARAAAAAGVEAVGPRAV